MKTKKLLSLLLLITMVIGLAANGCGKVPVVAPSTAVAGDVSASTVASTVASTEASTVASVAPAVLEDGIVVTMWHGWTEDVNGTTAAKEFKKGFEAANPGITIKEVAMQQEDLRKTIKPALTSGEGPDVFFYDCGPGYLGVLAKAGLIASLEDAAVQYGWKSRLTGWGQKSAMYNGQMYGIAAQYEMLTTYYNKKIFSDLGVSVPTTYEQFVDICQKAKDAGIVGLTIDDKDQWPGFHYESLFYGAFAGPDKIREVLDKKGAWNQPVFAAGLDALASLVKNGYTTPDPNAISHDDALKDFYSGKGAMYLTGTWQIGTMSENMGDNVGIFVFPAKDGIPSVPPVGVGGGMLVNKAAKNMDATMKFMDYMFSKEGAKIWLTQDSSIPPVDIDLSSLDLNPLFKEVVAIAGATDSFNANIDVLMPQNVNDATLNYMQEILAGVKTGEQATTIKQVEYQKAIDAGNY